MSCEGVFKGAHITLYPNLPHKIDIGLPPAVQKKTPPTK